MKGCVNTETKVSKVFCYFLLMRQMSVKTKIQKTSCLDISYNFYNVFHHNLDIFMK